MRLIGNRTKLRLILGGGERLEGQCGNLRSVSATSAKCVTAVEKPVRSLRIAGISPRPVVC